MNKNSIIIATNFLVFIALQIFAFKNFVLFDVGFSFVYLICLLLLPIEFGFLAVMFLGFGTGLIVDIFYNTLGIHASACVAMAFIRPFWAKVITPRSGNYEVNVIPTVHAYGAPWFISYAYPLLIIHHVVFFFIEAGGFEFLGHTLLKILVSSALSLVFIISIQYLFFAKQK
jgi:hypothetical protein